MIISDTSALVLNWTSKDIWKSENAQNYFARLDLNAADLLLQTFNPYENYMHTQSVSNRKFFMRKSAIEFLEECRRNGMSGQVIILAAGIAPLSVEIASLYKESKVFDVDRYLMADKERYLDNVCSNISFIECDITEIKLLKEKLLEKGWNIKAPGLLIMEGIIYYLTEDDLKNLFTFFSGNNFRLACDFGLKPEFVNEKNRIYGVEVFRKIKDFVGLEFVSFYQPDYYMNLIKQCGFENATRFTMDSIQKERTGAKTPFDYDEPGWIAMVKN